MLMLELLESSILRVVSSKIDVEARMTRGVFEWDQILDILDGSPIALMNEMYHSTKCVCLLWTNYLKLIAARGLPPSQNECRSRC